ncbi:hypothetical protein BVX98_03465 [bacterium F11]|nr:hypothetical protein BVX98_03465 [bacterium F11]
MVVINGHLPRPLSSLKPGEEGVIDSVQTSPETRRKLMEMGIGPGERIRFVRSSPFGDPNVFELLKCRLALRKSESDRIILKPLTPSFAG